MIRRNAVLLGTLALALICLACSSWILANRAGSSGAPVSGPTSPEPDLAGGAAAILETIHMSPRGLGDLGRVRDALAMAAVSEESGTRGELSELLDQVAEFITLRYAVAAKPEEYIAWRKRQGYVWTARDRLESGWTLHDAFPLIVTDARFPGYDHLDEFVRLTFHPVLDLRGGVSRPVALADESRGVVVHHGWLSAGNPTRELLHGELDAAMWHGHSSASACAIWAPPRDLQTMLKEDTLVEYADVGIITEFADGARRPLIQTWIWDPKRSRWYLMYVNQQHVEGVELSAGYY